MIANEYFYGMVPVSIDITNEERTAILREFPVPSLSVAEGGFSIENEVHGNQVRGVTLLLNEFSIERTQGANPKPYFKMKFSNHLGTYSAKMWDNDGAVERYSPLLEEHSVFQVSGKVEEFKSFKSITISELNVIGDDIDPFTLIACTEQSLEDFTVELHHYLSELEEPFRSIGFAGMKRFWQEFRVRPAAMGHHHAYLGGLLKHTVGLMRLARFILKQDENHFKVVLRLINQVEKVYKQELWNDLQSDNPGGSPRNLVWKDSVDHLYSMFYGMAKHRDEKPNVSLLMCAILYHDIGKLMEYHHAGKGTEEFRFLYPTADANSLQYRKPTGITMDELGVLVGHIPYGVMIVGKIIETENINMTLEDIHRLQHAILCHHGKLEWGANIAPKTIEGYLIHIVDYLDSRYERTEEVK
ncbi:HD domain-containing protein [Bacillus timonensis]|nr:HD domain-containing protein [Bacillus timonensis]